MAAGGVHLVVSPEGLPILIHFTSDPTEQWWAMVRCLQLLCVQAGNCTFRALKLALFFLIYFNNKKKKASFYS